MAGSYRYAPDVSEGSPSGPSERGTSGPSGPSERGSSEAGVLALMGGEEFEDPCRDVDAALLEVSGGTDVLVIPTAAAFENPRRVVETAEAYFSGFGATVRHVMVLHHAEADDREAGAAVRDAAFVYLPGGSPMHLRAVLHGSALWEAIQDAYRGGAVLAASGSGAIVLCNPMIDPRGGAYTVGLGLLANVAVFPHHDTVPEHLWERAVDLRPAETLLVGIDEHTAVLRDADASWRALGPGKVTVDGDGVSKSYSNGPVDALTV